VPPGCGRPAWIDDPIFDLRPAPDQPPVDQDAPFDLAAKTHRTGLIICFHHVLADGMGGLARFLDTDPASPHPRPPLPFPHPAPSPRQMAVDV
jgi:hypothetical protein